MELQAFKLLSSFWIDIELWNMFNCFQINYGENRHVIEMNNKLKELKSDRNTLVVWIVEMFAQRSRPNK